LEARHGCSRCLGRARRIARKQIAVVERSVELAQLTLAEAMDAAAGNFACLYLVVPSVDRPAVEAAVRQHDRLVVGLDGLMEARS